MEGDGDGKLLSRLGSSPEAESLLNTLHRTGFPKLLSVIPK